MKKLPSICAVSNHQRLCLFLSLISATITSGCGQSLDYTVKQSYLKEMSRQGQLWIYDAENEIIVALDKLDEAKDNLHEIRLQIAKAQKSVETAEKKNKRSVVEVAEEWVKYLESLETWAEENIELQQNGVMLAKAGVELAKAQVINREDLLGGKDFSVKDYQEQYNELKKEFELFQKRVDKLRKRARRREKKWWTIRNRSVAQTGDYDSGLWIE